ncbi:MAG: hypothetical protein IJY73_09535 [Oscillospiraceae bacterium]|nr:hypothetical protein [Oscillospiraceae bacterium]
MFGKEKNQEEMPWGSLETGESCNLVVQRVRFTDKDASADNDKEYSMYFVSPYIANATDEQLYAHAESIANFDVSKHVGHQDSFDEMSIPSTGGKLSYLTNTSIQNRDAGNELAGVHYCRASMSFAQDLKESINYDADKDCESIKQTAEQAFSDYASKLTGGKDVTFTGCDTFVANGIDKDSELFMARHFQASPISNASFEKQIEAMSKVNEYAKTKEQERAAEEQRKAETQQKWQGIKSRFLGAIGMNGVTADTEQSKSNDQYGQ